MCVLSIGLRVDRSNFEQGKHAYESGRSIGGVYTCKTCAIWLSQSHELVRACHTEFTVSMSFRGTLRQPWARAVEMADYIPQKFQSTAKSA